jgi:hypothetical protein
MSVSTFCTGNFVVFQPIFAAVRANIGENVRVPAEGSNSVCGVKVCGHET